MDNHYEQPRLFESILASLKEEGIDEYSVTRHDISNLDEFHLQGARISVELAQKVQIEPGQKILDVGCGVGGPCRMLADQFEADVVGVDYTREYIRTARALSRLVDLADNTEFIEADALDLPFAANTFDVVWTQHAQMNIQDKARFYAEIQRVLKTGGSFAYYDIFDAGNGPVYFPVPWAEVPESSHLMKHKEVLHYFDQKEWEWTFHEDHTQNALQVLSETMQEAKLAGPPKLGLNLLMRGSTKAKLGNLLRCLQENKVEVHAGIFRKN